jgi:NADH-quinone oxidoreductase subunit B
VALADVGGTGTPLRFTVDQAGRRYTLWVANVGLACCAVEFVAASLRAAEGSAVGGFPAGDGADGDLARVPRVDVLVISGTVTDALAPQIRRIYLERTPRPYVLSFGACSNSGGPYWDSYVVTKGIDQIIPVDIYVPGCPPRPEALLDGLARLAVLTDSASSDPIGPAAQPVVATGHDRGARR